MYFKETGNTEIMFSDYLYKLIIIILAINTLNKINYLSFSIIYTWWNITTCYPNQRTKSYKISEEHMNTICVDYLH